MERDGNQSSNLPKPSSAGFLITANGAPTSRLPVRRPPPMGSFPLSSPAVVDWNGAGSRRGNSKGKAVDHLSPNINAHNSNNKNKGKSGGGNGAGGREARREQDMYMPITNVVRIMRQVLPLNVKIGDDAKETIQECVSEYISFVTGEANERCRQEQRKTITAEDLLYAMCKLGFEDYIGPLTVYLQRYRAAEGDTRGSQLRGAARGEPCPSVKRNATDAGLFMQQNHEHLAQSSPTYTMAHSCLPLYPFLQGPPAFFHGAGGSSFAAAGVQGLLRPPTPRAPIPLPPRVPIPLLPLAPMALLPPAPVPLNYYRQEAPVNRDTTAEANVYMEIARYREDVPIYGDLGGHNDMAGSTSSGDDAGPSPQAAFSEFEPFALYK